MSDYFEFYCPVKILMGEKALEHIPFELDQLCVKRPLIITDAGVLSAGLIGILSGAFAGSGVTLDAVFSEVPPDSSLMTVQKCAAMYRDVQADAIIAVGGGSVLDTAKGVNLMISEDVSDLVQLSGAGILKRPLKPLLAIPTTAGTGSEVTLAAVITDENVSRKLLFISPFLLPQVAVLDARMTMTLPPQMTAATAIDALTHSVEAYTCLAKNPLSDAYAFSAIQTIFSHLPAVMDNPRDRDGRLALMLAATNAGIAFSNSMVGMVHTLGHSVGSCCHVPHGTAMSILLPHVLEYNLERATEAFKKHLGDLLLAMAGADVFASTQPGQRAQKSIENIRAFKNLLFTKTALPRTLEETGKVTSDKLPEIARVSLGDASAIYNPAEMEYDDALHVLKRAWSSV